VFYDEVFLRVLLFHFCGLRVILFYSCDRLNIKFWCFIILWFAFHDCILGYVFICLWCYFMFYDCIW